MTEYAVPKQPTVRKVPSKTPDYNPDKERHVEHSFIVQKADRSAGNTVALGDKVIKLDRNGRAVIKDEVLAREIQQEHRWNMAVTRVRTPSPGERGHTYFFGSMPEMPWKRKKVEDVTVEKGQEQESDQPEYQDGNGPRETEGTSHSDRPA